MRNKYLIPAAVLALSAAFAAGIFWQRHLQALAQIPQCASVGEQNHVGSAVLVGEIEAFSHESAADAITLRLADRVFGNERAGQAALEAGTCTLERLENYECTPNNFFVRHSDTRLTLPVSPSATVEVYAGAPAGYLADSRGDIYTEKISFADLIGRFAPAPSLKYESFTITTTHGVITKIQQQYLP